MAACDGCAQPLHLDASGWWVGPDETSDCPASASGHLVTGEARADAGEPDEQDTDCHCGPMTVHGDPPPMVPITEAELDLERARAMAVALEQELAELQHRYDQLVAIASGEVDHASLAITHAMATAERIRSGWGR